MLLINPYLLSGELTYTNTGTTQNYDFYIPPGVTSICAVAVGKGGDGSPIGTTDSFDGRGGGGGGLAYVNDVAVTPGQSVRVNFSSSVVSVSIDGGVTYVLQVACGSNGLDGGSGGYVITGTGGSGGNGGSPDNGTSAATFWGGGGGGGAGGYSGNGGNGGNASPDNGDNATNGSNGSGGGGGGGGGGGALFESWYDPLGIYTDGAVMSGVHRGGEGGGVGIYGTGSSGTGGAKGAPYYGTPPYAGQNGTAGSSGSGKTYGGGGLGGGGGDILTSSYVSLNVVLDRAPFNQLLPSTGGPAAVRIIWGPDRSFPSNAS